MGDDRHPRRRREELPVPAYRRRRSRSGARGGAHPETGIFSLRADAIHAIEIPPDRPLSGLHVYGGNILQRSSRSAWDPDTMEEVPYRYERLMEFCKVLTRKRETQAS